MMSDLCQGLGHTAESRHLCDICDISCWRIDGDESEKCNTVPDDSPPMRKLFIGNLPNKISHHDLRFIFSQFGRVKSCHISRKKNGGRKNYGFVTFQFPEDALLALNAPAQSYYLNGHQLIVAPADSWHQPIELPDGRVQWRRNRANPNEDEEHEKLAIRNSVSKPLPCEDEEIDESKCKVHILNDDCLMHIFSFLSQRERIRIERVCKRWQATALSMWVYEQHLEISSLFPRGKTLPNFIRLNGLLQRCGPNLSSLDLTCKPHELKGNVLSLVAKYTPNLRCLNLSGVALNSSGISALSKVSHQLRHLNLGCCSGLQDRDLQNLFLKCPLLETVILSHNNHLTGKFLLGLKKSNLTTLVLNECNNIHSRVLVIGLQNLKKLETLSLNSCINLTGGDVADIVKTVPHLTSLSIERYFPLMNNTALHSLNLLHDLVSLQLGLNPAVNDKVLEVISKSCLKLKKLDITGCTIPASGDSASLTDRGLKYLARLPCLENLSASYLADVSDDALDTIADKGLLKVLKCRGCPTFTDAGCMRVVALCTELELFDFSGCDYVSELTINAAKDAVKLRTNNVKLTLIVGGTKITSDVLNEEVPPLLCLDFRNLCLAHLRPDFEDDLYFPPSDDVDDDDDRLFNGLVEIVGDGDFSGFSSEDDLEELVEIGFNDYYDSYSDFWL
ncbi:F-box/LRR-repeat protein 20 isoform X2 [Anabrus simplex]